ncbi:MAG TPA: hypothetical protein VFL30_05750 [Rhodanobacteraceae bacterium]|nr:hypothetical protein [Rhodanobacteraceae bacterium]
MKKGHRPIGRAYGDQRRESHDDGGESRARPRRDYRIDMKSLFMRAQQVAFVPADRFAEALELIDTARVWRIADRVGIAPGRVMADRVAALADMT